MADVLRMQERYEEAIVEYAAARTLFEHQNEPKMVAVSWHQTGMVYQEAGQYDTAEAAYRQSLEIKTRMGDRAAQASSLIALGVLYNDFMNRPRRRGDLLQANGNYLC